MKAAIVLDNWKLPIFRERLTEAGYDYEDAGPAPGDSTALTVHFTDLPALNKVVKGCEAECQRRGKPE